MYLINWGGWELRLMVVVVLMRHGGAVRREGVTWCAWWWCDRVPVPCPSWPEETCALIVNDDW